MKSANSFYINANSYNKLSAVPLSASPYTAPSDGAFVWSLLLTSRTIYPVLNGVSLSGFSENGPSSGRDSKPIVFYLKKGDKFYFNQTTEITAIGFYSTQSR